MLITDPDPLFCIGNIHVYLGNFDAHETAAVLVVELFPLFVDFSFSLCFAESGSSCGCSLGEVTPLQLIMWGVWFMAGSLMEILFLVGPCHLHLQDPGVD